MPSFPILLHWWEYSNFQTFGSFQARGQSSIAEHTLELSHEQVGELQQIVSPALERWHLGCTLESDGGILLCLREPMCCLFLLQISSKYFSFLASIKPQFGKLLRWSWERFDFYFSFRAEKPGVSLLNLRAPHFPYSTSILPIPSAESSSKGKVPFKTSWFLKPSFRVTLDFVTLLCVSILCLTISVSTAAWSSSLSSLACFFLILFQISKRCFSVQL